MPPNARSSTTQTVPRSRTAVDRHERESIKQKNKEGFTCVRQYGEYMLICEMRDWSGVEVALPSRSRSLHAAVTPPKAAESESLHKV